ncbi:hypothetical protein B4U79_16185 [Dinothrombium tinctorium]|uniref:BHLH domain-containing protein n=1 Tax=Dinothrombium tinctorium TaxID=1965070 RepID=A0A3S3PCZ1_9ACAR|nr:hypothetical protein B4U79_16963 [Dinothrombium tinctorium]RWS16325.1 hypothetical protein B4U79_16960 [Dinothrombium tinctorium]RWS16979.1 hypothetical protein B4U79_16185 [Dinothrombium tinctorium]
MAPQIPVEDDGMNVRKSDEVARKSNKRSSSLRSSVKVCPKTKRLQVNEEYLKLRSLVPSIAHNEKISKIEIIYEAVRHINHLHDQILHKISDGKLKNFSDLSLTLYGQKPSLKEIHAIVNKIQK